MNTLPDFQVDTLRLEDGRRLRIVRDDIIPGGTKQRVLEHILKPKYEYVYPSPVFGYAQIALALAARNVGAKATIFVAKRNELHERTQRAKDAGAKIIEVPYGMLSVVNARACEYVLRSSLPRTVGLPEGFAWPEFHEQLVTLVKAMKLRPKQVWCVASTGVLMRGLQEAWPGADFQVVRVGMMPPTGRYRLWTAPETYQKNAKLPPPYPSCSNSDSKIWQFAVNTAIDGALIWNVAA